MRHELSVSCDIKGWPSGGDECSVGVSDIILIGDFFPSKSYYVFTYMVVDWREFR